MGGWGRGYWAAITGSPTPHLASLVSLKGAEGALGGWGRGRGYWAAITGSPTPHLASLVSLGGGAGGAGRGKILGSYNRLTYTSSNISSESEGAGGALGGWGRGYWAAITGSPTPHLAHLASLRGAGGALGGWGRGRGYWAAITGSPTPHLASLVSLGGRGRVLGSYNRLTYTSSSISSESEGAGGPWGAGGEDIGQLQQAHLHLI